MSFIKKTLFLAAIACLIILPGRPAFAGQTCHISGRVYCSEYGTRYKEPVTVVFVGPGEARYPAPLGEVEGAFQAEVPSGASYDIRVEFSGNGFSLGTLDLPDSAGECAKTVEIYHPGSMLELVWEARAGSADGMDFKVKDAKAK